MRRTTFGFLAAASTLALAASKATSPNIAAALKASAAGSSLRQGSMVAITLASAARSRISDANKCTTGTCTCSACRSAVAGIPNVSARRRKACAVTSPLRSNGRVPLSELVRDLTVSRRR